MQCAGSLDPRFRRGDGIRPRRDPPSPFLRQSAVTALAEFARSLAERPRPVTLYGAPEGYEAAAIGDIVAEGHVLPWLHVCRDDGRMARFAAALAFFHPELDALTFPAWDCLPYDRVSPNSDIVSRRIDTLTRLATGGGDTPLVVLTTVNALIQRVPPRSLFDGRVLTLRPGGRIGLDRLQSFFRNNGYIRTDTVREPGEFAIRGGIVDLYPAGAAEPLRLDFFGDTLESIRSFDPLTQRSTGKLDQAALRPVSEVLLDDAAIRRFRSRYREQFGATGTDDPLYESVSAGRRYVGMEHWLPLYYEQLETLFNYLPAPGSRSTIRPTRCATIVSKRSPISTRRATASPGRHAPGRRSIARYGRRSSTSTISNGRRGCVGERSSGCRPLPHPR